MVFLTVLGVTVFLYKERIFFNQKINNEIIKSSVIVDISSVEKEPQNSSHSTVSVHSIQKGNNFLNQTGNTSFFSESDVIFEQLRQLSETFNWSDSERLSNASLWQEACDSVKDFINNDSDFFALGQADMSFVESKKLSELCSDFSLQNELDTLDFALENVNKPSLINVQKNKLERDLVLKNDGEEAVLKLIATQISNSLKRLDESSLYEPLWYLADKKLISSPIHDEEVNSHVLYFNVIQETASVLLCQSIGGCIGSGHPMVLRQCLNAKSNRGSFCYKPYDIYDATYQILSPLQFQAFESMLTELNILLSDL